MLNVEKIFVLHYTKLIERKARLDEYFKDYNIDVEYILEYDQEELTEDIIQEWYKKDPQSYADTIDKCYKMGSTPFRELNLAEISCTIKHILGIKSIAEKCDSYGLILEDDVVFAEDFKNKFNSFIEKTPEDWDVIFMGCCGGLRVPQSYIKKDKVAYQVNHPASRGGDSYLLKKEAAEKIYETIKPFNTVSDWELSYQFYLHDMKVYWWEPPLVIQGSQNGLYKSTLR